MRNRNGCWRGLIAVSVNDDKKTCKAHSLPYTDWKQGWADFKAGKYPEAETMMTSYVPCVVRSMEW